MALAPYALLPGHRPRGLSGRLRCSLAQLQRPVAALAIIARSWCGVSAPVEPPAHGGLEVERRVQKLADLADTATRAAQVAEDEAAASAELLGRISHAMRTPLNAIIGFSDLMNKELLGPLGHLRYQEYCHHIREAGFDLLGATEDVLAITRLANLPPSTRSRNVEIGSILTEAVRTVAGAARSRGLKITQTEPGECTALADPRGLRQALTSILNEAVGRASPGSMIACTVAADGAQVRIEVAVESQHAAGAPIHARSGHSGGTERATHDKSLSLAIAEALLALQGGRLDVAGLYASPGLICVVLAGCEPRHRAQMPRAGAIHHGYGDVVAA